LTKLLLIAATAALALAPAAHAAEGGVFPYPTRVEKLDNGLTVVLIPMSSGGLVAYWTIVRTGSRDEYEAGHTGFAHFFEHMMFRGTEKYPAEVYNAKITEMGANANAFTTEDFTAFYLGIAAADLPTAMELESDRFEHLSYPEAAFKTEAGAVYGEYRKGRTSPFFVLYEALRKAAFTTHTYGHTVIGFEADIQAMPKMYDYSRSFFARYYRPDNAVLLIVGDVEVEPTLALVEKYYGDWRPGYVEPQVPAEPEQTAERRLEVSYSGRSLPLLWIGYKAPRFAPGDRRLAALDVLSDLAFGETSELYRKLVLEDQVVDTLQAEPPRSRDPGLLDVLARVKDPAKVDTVLAAIDETIAHYQAVPPDPQRLADLKSRLRYGFLMGLDTPGRVAGNLTPILALTADVGAVDRLFSTFEAVTPADVQAVARDFLVPQHRTVGILRGEEE
jgi:zinc protease